MRNKTNKRGKRGKMEDGRKSGPQEICKPGPTGREQNKGGKIDDHSLVLEARIPSGNCAGDGGKRAEGLKQRTNISCAGQSK